VRKARGVFLRARKVSREILHVASLGVLILMKGTKQVLVKKEEDQFRYFSSFLPKISVTGISGFIRNYKNKAGMKKPTYQPRRFAMLLKYKGSFGGRLPNVQATFIRV
jgi:hypothetical protein